MNPIIAQTTDPLLNLVQYGVLGLIVLGFMMGWIWPKPGVQHLIDSNERLMQEIKNMLRDILSELKDQNR